MNLEIPLCLETIWACEPTQFAAWVAQMRERPTAENAVVQALILRGRQEETLYETADGVAIIEISGVIAKRTWWGTSTATVRQAVVAALADRQVKAILLQIDSPGGSVDGLAELGDALYAARQVKPLYAQSVGMAASAAYYLGAQAEKFYAQRMDLIGSIGTRLMLYDFSKAFEDFGIRAIPIDTGKLKSAGAAGTKITDEQQTYFQSIVDNYYADFLAAIMRGRGMSAQTLRAEPIGDGGVLPATQALSLGLIDGLQTMEETLALLRGLTIASAVGASAQLETTAMNNQSGSASTETAEGHKDATPPQSTAAPPAILLELREKIPGSDAAFREECIAAGLSLGDALERFAKRQQATIDALNEQIAVLKASGKKSGVEAVGTQTPKKKATTAAGTGDPVADFREAVRERMDRGMNQQRAVESLALADPDLHEAFLLATNTGAKARRLVEEKYG